MKDEPAIVKELREEEKKGKLFRKTKFSYDDYGCPETSFMNPMEKDQRKEEAAQAGRMVHVSIDYERKLLEAEEKYEKIFRLSPEAIVLIDKTGVLVDMNARLNDWLGYRQDEIIGHSLIELPFLAPEEITKAKNNFLLRVNGKDVPPYELEFMAKNGEKKIGLVRGVPLKDEYRNVTHDLVMISDVTKEKKAQETLQQTLAHLKELEFIVNHSGAVAFIWRAQEGWPVEFVSENIAQFGYTKEEFLAQRLTYASIIHQDDLSWVTKEVIAHSDAGAQEFTQEYRIRTKAGEIRWVDDRTWIRRDQTGTTTQYQGIILDISKRKKAEAELTKAHEQLSELNKKLEQRIRATSKKPL